MALNHEEIKKDPQRITKIKPFINKYNWEGMNFPSAKDDLRKFQKIVVKIALNVLYAKKKTAYVSKKNSNLEKQVILLKIPNGKKGSEVSLGDVKLNPKNDDDAILELKNYQHY